MTTQEIYNLANELTNQNINNIIGGWNKEDILSFDRLVKLGDSKKLACATVISEKYNKIDNYKQCYEAYCI